MNIYHYHPVTGVFLCEGIADESPLEPGEWLIPAHATADPPPVPGAGEQVVRTGDIWQVQPMPLPEPEPLPPTPPPALSPGYYAFWDALIASNVYGSIRAQSMASLPMNTLATEFIALIGDAKAGRPNTAAIQSSISAILSTGSFTSDDIEEFQAALVAGNLAGVYELSQELS